MSRGVLFPKFRGDLVQTAVVVERMRAGAIESLRVPANPVDVLAQQIVAMCALDEWTVDDLEAVVRRATPFASLPRSILESVLDMLSGRYPSDEFAELRPRIVWDRVTGVLTGRPGAQRLAVTSGGTIPDRGLYAVFLASSEGAGRRVGELDEEMVYESRVGDVFTLGTSTWRIEDITHDQVLVTPAPGTARAAAVLEGRPAGAPRRARAGGRRVRPRGGRAVAGQGPRPGRRPPGSTSGRPTTCSAYLAEQQEATRHVPDDRTIVVERFRDEIGDWRVAVHSPFGGQVHAPWALCVSARMRERFGVDVQAMHGDDGIVFRLPDLEFEDEGSGTRRGCRAARAGHASTPTTCTTSSPPRSAGRPCSRPGSASAPRARCCCRVADPTGASRCGSSASGRPSCSRSPASTPPSRSSWRRCASASRTCSTCPGSTALMRSIESREVTLVDVESSQPSPFARSLMFGYVAQFLYEGDSPLAEKRAAALALDPTLLAELLGRGEGLSLRDLLDPEQVTRTESELQRLVARAGLPRRRGRRRPAAGARPAAARRDPGDGRRTPLTHQEIGGWLVDLEGARRLIRVRVAGQERWAAIEDAGRLRDALGSSLPVGVPQTFLESVPDPLGDLVRRYARTHGPFPAAAVAAWWGVGPAVALDALRRLVSSGRVVEGELLPTENGGGVHGLDYCDAEVLRLLRRRSLAALRAEVEPVPAVELARFLPQWQSRRGWPAGPRGAGPGRRAARRGGAAGQRPGDPGAAHPRRRLLPRPARRADQQRRGALARPRLAARRRRLGVPAPRRHRPPDPGAAHRPGARPRPSRPWSTPSPGAAPTSSAPSPTPSAAPTTSQLLADLWALAWDGRVSNDTLAPLRALLVGRPHQPQAQPVRARAPPGMPGAGARWAPCPDSAGWAGPPLPTRSGPPAGAGRWSLLPEVEPDATVRAYATAEVLLDRYGVVTRGSVVAEEVPGGFAGVYRVLAAAEESGRVRRGYFVESLGASQFSTTGAVDRLRAGARPVGDEADRGGPGDGAGRHRPGQRLRRRPPLAGPRRRPGRRSPDAATADTAIGSTAAASRRRAGKRGHQPARKAGALVVLVDGELVLYVERGGKTLLSWTDDAQSPPGCGRRAGPRGPRGGARPAHRREGRRRRGARLGPPPRVRRWPAPGSTPRRAGCGCAGERRHRGPARSGRA